VVNQLLPVPLTRVEVDPRLGQYPVRTTERSLCGENLIQFPDNRQFPSPPLYLSGTPSEESTAHRRRYPFMHRRGFGGCGPIPSSVKSTVRLGGTYDMNGELTSEMDEKGLYIDRFS
jgi:hypothetical protein